jgi:hypothetical protein
MYDRSGEGDFVEKRYVVNLDKDVESSCFSLAFLGGEDR